MHIDAMDSFRIIITDQIRETIRNGLMSGLCPATITQHLSYPFDPTALKETRRLFEDKSTIIPLNDHKVWLSNRTTTSWTTHPSTQIVSSRLVDRLNPCLTVFNSRGRTQVKSHDLTPIMKIEYLVVGGVCFVVDPARSIINFNPCWGMRSHLPTNQLKSMHECKFW